MTTTGVATAALAGATPANFPALRDLTVKAMLHLPYAYDYMSTAMRATAATLERLTADGHWVSGGTAALFTTAGKLPALTELNWAFLLTLSVTDLAIALAGWGPMPAAWDVPPSLEVLSRTLVGFDPPIRFLECTLEDKFSARCARLETIADLLV
eukprot:contig_22023_g5437